jgi:hypothetical protein
MAKRRSLTTIDADHPAIAVYYATLAEYKSQLASRFAALHYAQCSANQLSRSKSEREINRVPYRNVAFRSFHGHSVSAT